MSQFTWVRFSLSYWFWDDGSSRLFSEIEYFPEPFAVFLKMDRDVWEEPWVFCRILLFNRSGCGISARKGSPEVGFCEA